MEDRNKVLQMVIAMLGEISVKGKYSETYAKCLNTLGALEKEMSEKTIKESGD